MSESTRPTASWLIVGCGYVGERLARMRRAAGDTVFAVTRTTARAKYLSSLGVQPVVGHWLDPTSLPSLPAVDFIVVSVPHRVDPLWPTQPSQGRTTKDNHANEDDKFIKQHAQGLNHLLTCAPASWQKLIYLSTTGVYGQDSVDWVDEETPVCPTRMGPQMAVAGEQWLGAHVDAQRFTVLRLAGIYGPGRIPLAEKLRAGEPLAVPQAGYLNLIHVIDIARMIPCVAHGTLQHSIYLFADGQPVQRADFYHQLARLCGVEQPRFIAPDLSNPKLRRATDKRINPQRLVSETGFEYQFPSYLSGLHDALGES